MDITKMSKHVLASLVPTIYSEGRLTIRSATLGRMETFVLLNFIGAKDYFITEEGAIWERITAIKERERAPTRVLCRSYLPLVYKDRYLYLPWVRLRTDFGNLWFPVHQLLTWAYHPTETIDKDKVLLPESSLLPLHHSLITREVAVADLPERSLYRTFLKLLHS